jgi:hypothetical protein
MTVALSDLILAAQQRCDRVNASTITTQEWTSYVNGSAKELYGLLCSTYEDYNVSPYQFTLTGGDPPLNTLTLGPGSAVGDFYQARALWRQLTVTPQTRWARLKRTNLVERNMYTGPTVSLLYGQMPMAWNLLGSALEVLPSASSAGQYLLYYVPAMPSLVQQTDSIDKYWLTINGWEEYVVLDAAAKALIKEESYEAAAVMLQQKSACRERILREAAPRDDSEPARIIDIKSVDRNYGLEGWGGPNGGWGGW